MIFIHLRQLPTGQHAAWCAAGGRDHQALGGRGAAVSALARKLIELQVPDQPVRVRAPNGRTETHRSLFGLAAERREVRG